MTRTALRRPAGLLVGSWLGALVLLGLNPWYWRPFAGRELSEGAAVAVMAGVSLLVVVLPAAALSWLVLASTRHWHAGRVFRVALLLLPLPLLLHGLGRWSLGVYGLDPPYAFFWVGATLELAALLVPAAVAAWACGVVARRLRAAA